MNATTVDKTSKEGTCRVQVVHPDWSADAIADFRQLALSEYAVVDPCIAKQMDSVLFISDPGMFFISGRMSGAEQFLDDSLSVKRESGAVDAAAPGDADLPAVSFTSEATPDVPALSL